MTILKAICLYEYIPPQTLFGGGYIGVTLLVGRCSLFVWTFSQRLMDGFLSNFTGTFNLKPRCAYYNSVIVESFLVVWPFHDFFFIHSVSQ